MSRWDWNDILRLPDAALAGDRRVPKAALVRQALLTKTEQKVLDRVSAVTHFATVQRSTTRIPPAVDAGHDIQSVVFLRCEMAGSSAAYSDVARLLHKCFPNPTVVLFGGCGEACVSVAVTRRSLAEQGAMVIDEVQGTGGIDIDDEALAPFAEALAFDNLPQDDLLAYLRGMAWAVRLSRAVPSLGFYPACAERDRERLETLIAERDGAAAKVADLKLRRRDRDLTLNESAKLRMELKGCEKELEKAVNGIKEICNG